MSQKRNNLVGGLLLVTGVVVGAATALLIKENRPLNAGKVLAQVKEVFAQEGKLEGSWIDYDAIEYELFDSKPLVYIGGITRVEEDRRVQYQFAADVYTGDILDTYEVNSEHFV